MNTQASSISALLLSLFLSGGMLGLAPSAGAEPPECNDAIDNDGDGFADFPDDRGCLDHADSDETDPHCADGLDNDGDGASDYPGDSDCSSEADTDESYRGPQCSDGDDNDGDGYTDYPEDPECASAEDESEADFSHPDDFGGITIRYDRQRDRFLGHLSSDEPRGCRSGRLVRLKKVRPGRNRVVGSDRTDGIYRNHRWVIRKEEASGNFYSVAPEVTRERKDGSSVTCRPLRSVTIRVS
jgi:hypothetical protein